jgi:ABC-type glutathione transport system ATPase component
MCRRRRRRRREISVPLLWQGTVRQLMHKRIRDAYVHPQFMTDVMRPMKIDPIIDQEVMHLSGGELQRVAMALVLGKPCDVYLIDEPSAYLDSEQRITCAKVGCWPLTLPWKSRSVKHIICVQTFERCICTRVR